jgi:hypothetical protein
MSVCIYSVCRSWPCNRLIPPSKESCQLCIGLRNWKSCQGPKGCRAIENNNSSAEAVKKFNSSINSISGKQTAII